MFSFSLVFKTVTHGKTKTKSETNKRKNNETTVTRRVKKEGDEDDEEVIAWRRRSLKIAQKHKIRKTFGILLNSKVFISPFESLRIQKSIKSLNVYVANFKIRWNG